MSRLMFWHARLLQGLPVLLLLSLWVPGSWFTRAVTCEEFAPAALAEDVVTCH